MMSVAADGTMLPFTLFLKQNIYMILRRRMAQKGHDITEC